jgi:NAD(P)-dependent dehydrogenase (short-subunit alcohol dehydrogenase family)
VALAAAGADVVVTGTGRDPATFPADEKAVNWHDVHSTVEQIEAQGRRGLALIGDVSQQADVSRIVQHTLDTFGRIDILVNNAAIARGSDRVPVVELSEELFRRVLDVKLIGSFPGSFSFRNGVAQQGSPGGKGFVPGGVLLPRHAPHEPKPFPTVNEHDSTASAPHRGLRRVSRLALWSGPPPALARHALLGLWCAGVWRAPLECQRRMGAP